MPIYYESRISEFSLNASELPKLDEEFEEITEGEELTKKEKLKTKWTALNMRSSTNRKTPEQIAAAVPQLVCMVITTDARSLMCSRPRDSRAPTVRHMADQGIALGMRYWFIKP